ncbi:MAG TPA: FecR domain-containing protein [Myxococcaceae bacterium]|nr:FecR domain-containing protein [Myxococcaceae bacterium]
MALAAIPWSCSSDDSNVRGVPKLDGRSTKATLRQVTGDVRVKRAAGDDWLRATEKMELLANDKVRTLRGASTLIEFVNGSIVTIGDDALIGIAETRPTPGQERSDLTLVRGRLDAELDDPNKQSFSVNTPAATVRAGREIVFQ